MLASSQAKNGKYNNNKQRQEHVDQDDLSEEGSLDIRACSICHCSLDYSDRAAFFVEDRHEDYNEQQRQQEEEEEEESQSSFVFRKDDPYFDVELYDENNALLYCDSCDRLFHQHCHFVPVLTFNKNKPWYCLVCQANQTKQAKQKTNESDDWFVSPPAPSLATAVATATTNHYKKKRKQKSKQQLQLQQQQQQIQLQQHLLETIEATFRHSHKTLLAKQWQAALKQLTTALKTPISTFKRTSTSLEALLSTKRNRQHFLASQELIQCVTALVSSKYRLAKLLTSLEHARVATFGRHQFESLQHNCHQMPDEFVARVAFPFGRHYGRTYCPVSPEYECGSAQRKNNNNNNNNDADSFSLDQLRCSVCWQDTSDDDNDLVLCDGQGCFRAIHQRCCWPVVSELNDSDDWFCPICATTGHLLDTIPDELFHDDPRSQNIHWERVEDVFPEATHQMVVAQLLKSGTRNPSTDALIQTILKSTSFGVDDQDDTLSQDGHFDLDSYQKERQLLRQQENGDDHSSLSSSSSQATLQNLSDVELDIPSHELRHLEKEASSTTADNDSDNDSSEDQQSHRRQSRRLRHKRGPTDLGQLHAKNILTTKRHRTSVDYRKLNDCLFGDWSDHQLSKLEDDDEFLDRVVTTTGQSEDTLDDNNNEDSDSD